MVVNCSGMSQVIENEDFTNISPLPWCHSIKIRVRVTRDKQWSKDYPELVRRVDSDWGADLELFKCSSGNFRQALKEGRISLGHLWAEVYSHCIFEAMFELSPDPDAAIFDEYFQENEKDSDANSVVYDVWLFYKVKPPEELYGLEGIVTGYLIGLLEDKQFNIQRRLKDFIENRSEEVNDSIIESCLPI